jgi:hypothetical protein
MPKAIQSAMSIRAEINIDDVVGSLGVSDSLNAMPILNYSSFAHQYGTASTISLRGVEFIKAHESFFPVARETVALRMRATAPSGMAIYSIIGRALQMIGHNTQMA